MAGGRVLIRSVKAAAARPLVAFVAVAHLCLALGCATGPIWAEAVPGQVIDRGTGAPVVGAAVVSFYSQIRHVHGARNNKAFCHRRAITDAEGRFRLPAKACVSFALLHEDEGRFVDVYHPRYGRFANQFPNVESNELPLIFRIEPRPVGDWFTNPRRWESLCQSGHDDSQCKFLCDWAYGKSDQCHSKGD